MRCELIVLELQKKEKEPIRPTDDKDSADS